MNTELYDQLGVPPDASPEDIKAAYRGKAKQHHPDKGGDAEAFGAIQKAYDILGDEDKRARYDQTGSTDTMDRGARIEALARERFGSMLIESVQSSDVLSFGRNWINGALAQVGADRHRIEAERATLGIKAAAAEKLAARFKPKTARNIPKDVLSHVKREIDRMLAQAAEKLEVLDRLEVLLKEYDFEADPAPPRGSSTFTLEDAIRQAQFNTYTQW